MKIIFLNYIDRNMKKNYESLEIVFGCFDLSVNSSLSQQNKKNNLSIYFNDIANLMYIKNKYHEGKIGMWKEKA